VNDATFAKAVLSTIDYLEVREEKSRARAGWTQGKIWSRLGREPVAKLDRQNGAQGRHKVDACERTRPWTPEGRPFFPKKKGKQDKVSEKQLRISHCDLRLIG